MLKKGPHAELDRELKDLKLKCTVESVKGS